MAVRVRLTRVGSKKNPIWRVVVADRRSPRDGRFIEAIGHYNPQTKPSTIVLDHERLDHWLALGAEPTNTVKKLMRAKDNPQVAAAAIEEATQAQAEAEAAAPADPARAEEPEVAPEGEAPTEGTAEPDAEQDPAAPGEPEAEAETAEAAADAEDVAEGQAQSGDETP
jgi:small subunit ribosomal protein S16